MSNVAIGIDVGGTKALALMVARDGRVIAEMNSQTPHEVGLGAGEATAKVLVEQVNELCARQSLDPSQVPIGVGLPGMMRRDGHLAFAPIFKQPPERTSGPSWAMRSEIHECFVRMTRTAPPSPNTSGEPLGASRTLCW